MKQEGQVRIPSGCAIAAVISKSGDRISGELITNAMRPMHDRSNGLGGGFAGYGIYPEYKDFYALQVAVFTGEVYLILNGLPFLLCLRGHPDVNGGLAGGCRCKHYRVTSR